LYGQPPSSPSAGKPAYLTFLCIVTLVLGCLGALRGGCAAASLAGGGRAPFPERDRAAQMPPALQATFRKVEVEGKAIDARYGAINKSMILLQAVIGLAMAAGAVMVLQGKRPGDWVLRGAYVTTLVVGLASMVPFVLQMLAMRPLLDELSQQAQQLGGEEAAAANVLMLAMTGAMYGGICMGSLWLAFKFALFGHGLYYLGTPPAQESLLARWQDSSHLLEYTFDSRPLTSDLNHDHFRTLG
jgi:hypothetical protein